MFIGVPLAFAIIHFVRYLISWMNGPSKDGNIDGIEMEEGRAAGKQIEEERERERIKQMEKKKWANFEEISLR